MTILLHCGSHQAGNWLVTKLLCLTSTKKSEVTKLAKLFGKGA